MSVEFQVGRSGNISPYVRSRVGVAGGEEQIPPWRSPSGNSLGCSLSPEGTLSWFWGLKGAFCGWSLFFTSEQWSELNIKSQKTLFFCNNLMAKCHLKWCLVFIDLSVNILVSLQKILCVWLWGLPRTCRVGCWVLYDTCISFLSPKYAGSKTHVAPGVSCQEIVNLQRPCEQSKLERMQLT